MSLDLYKYCYLIGIGGIGMSAIARYFNEKGKNVYGYDQVKSDLCYNLENEGITINYSDDYFAIPQPIKNAKNNEVLVIYTAAIKSDHELFSFFLKKKYNIFKRAEILGIISRQSFTIAVAGTHGKTTTSTMLAHILKSSGKDATAILGGISSNYNTNLLLSAKEDILIVEADEYDRSFLHIHPDIAIITSVVSDHLDIYKDKENLHLAFLQFASQVKAKGMLLVEKSVSLNFITPNHGIILKYSANDVTDYFAKNIRVQNSKMFFDIVVKDIIQRRNAERNQIDIELLMPGIHNISNAVAASTVAHYLGLSLIDIAAGIASFKGVDRRFDKHIDTNRLVYIDDYAHLPDEISVTIDTAKQLYPLRKLMVVFQPHLFTRTKDFADDFAKSLEAADDLVLLDIYPAREKPIAGINSQMLLDLCNNTKRQLCSKEDLLSILEKKQIDVLLTIGAGDISTLVQPIKYMLN